MQNTINMRANEFPMEIRQSELAKLLGVHPSTILRHAEALDIKPIEKESKAKLYTLDDAIKIMKHMKLPDEKIAEIIAKLQGGGEGQNEKTIEESEETIKKEKTPKKPPIPATHITTFLRAVDKNLASTFSKFAEQVDWFSTAVNEIGLFAIITAISTMKLTPDELEERLFSYRNPYEFVHDVVERLMALFRATEDAKAVYNLQKKINEYRFYLDKALDLIEELKRKNAEYEQEILRLLAALYNYDQKFAIGYIYAKGINLQRFQQLAKAKLDGNEINNYNKKKIEVV